MSGIDILFSWNNKDFSETNEFIFNSMSPGSILKINHSHLIDIIEMRNEERRWYYKGDHSPLLNSDSVDDSADYYIYFNIHKDNTFKSELTREDGNYKVYINNIEVDNIITMIHFEVIVFKHKI